MKQPIIIWRMDVICKFIAPEDMIKILYSLIEPRYEKAHRYYPRYSLN